MDLAFLGLDGLDEIVASSFGLDNRDVVDRQPMKIITRLTLRSTTTYSQDPGLIWFSFSEAYFGVDVRPGKYVADMSIAVPTSLSCFSLREAM